MARLAFGLPLLIPSLLLGPAPLSAQVDLEAAERTLQEMFVRPAGTPISGEQKEALGRFLEHYEGQDLRYLSYAHALHHYLQRDYDEALEALDAFFDRYQRIEHPEHEAMAGRIYLNAVARARRGEAPDPVRLARWSERLARLYPDLTMVARVAGPVLERLDDPAPVRVALARGASTGGAAPTAVDAFLATLYEAKAGRRDQIPATPIARAPTPAGAVPSETKYAPLGIGDLVPDFPVLRTLDGSEPRTIRDLRGKVVVLDFWATWCPPCRAVIPSLVKDQEEYGDEVQFVGVTRFYGRGMDFSVEGATLPHGGKPVTDLTPEEEVRVNQAFVEAFEVDYPILFVDRAVSADLFQVEGIPTLFVIGRDGKLAGKVAGGGEAQHRTLRELIEDARERQ